MDKKNYYAKRTSPFVWLAVLLAISSAVVLIWSARTNVPVSPSKMMFQILLPLFSNILFVLLLLTNCETRLYRITLPVILIPAYVFLRSSSPPMLKLFTLFVCLALAVGYAMTISGKVRFRFQAALLLIADAAIYFTYLCYQHTIFGAIQQDLPLFLTAVAALVILLIMQPVPADGTHHATWGDRSDGRRIRTLPPISQVTPYIMKTRIGASNYLHTHFEISQMESFVHQMRQDGYKGLGLMHILLAAYIRTVSQYPALNRFIAGQHVYTRDKIIICMTVKKEMSLSAPDTVIKLEFDPQDTVLDVYRKFSEKIDEIRNTPLDSSFDNLALALIQMPGLLLRFVVWQLNILDYFGLIPKKLLDLSPFHGSFFLTSLGSLGIPPVYHHLYNFGNLPVFMAFGAKYTENKLRRDGTVETQKLIDCNFSLDERICDGFYYAAALRSIRRYLQHPEQLLTPPEQVIRDID